MEPEKKQEVVMQQDDVVSQPQDDQADSDKPPGPQGDELGLDADASGSGDAFGLKAKKGGTSLIGSGGGGGTGYGWYTRKIGDELQEIVNNIIQKKGGVKDKNLKTEIQIRLDDSGKIAELTIITPSGSEELDEAVKQAASSVQLDAPLPSGMSRLLRFRIRSKG